MWPPETWQEYGSVLSGEAELRGAVVQVALALVGKRAPDPTYVRALYPWDDPRTADALARGQHKCALTAMAILRGVGEELPGDGAPYRVGTAMAILQRLPAWRRVNRAPDLGDVVIIERPGSPALTHARTVVETDGDVVLSVDGHYGLEPVNLVRSQIVVVSGEVWLRDFTQRRVLGVVSAGELRPTRRPSLPG